MRKFASWFLAAWILTGCENPNEPPTLYTKLPASRSSIFFQNKIEETPELNILTYEYLYNGGGVATADFNNDGLCDIYFSGNTVSNKLYLNQGELKFLDVTQGAGVSGRESWKTGVSVVDINDDGWLDIYLCYSGADTTHFLSNELYLNNGVNKSGSLTFTEKAAEYGLDAPNTFSTQASFFDYDRDGDLDMFLINHGNHFFSPFINTNKLRNMRHPQFGNRLYRHEIEKVNGVLKHFFKEVSSEAGIHGGGINFSLGVSVSDFNNDKWPDIYVTNDYEEQDFLYINNQKGGFVDITKKSLDHLSRNGMGTDAADFNNDGRIDLIEVDMWPEDNYRQKLLRGPDDYYRYQLMLDSGFHHQQMRNTLQLNNGTDQNGIPIFSEIGQLAGVSSTDWSWAPLFLDADNDGYKDLFITNGYLRDFTSMDFLKYTVEEEKKRATVEGRSLELYKLISRMSSTKTTDYLFKNNGDLSFLNVSKPWGINEPNLSFGAAYADLDNDGDLELITNNTNEIATIWKNSCSEKKLNSYLKIKLKGSAGNQFGIGAKIFLETDSHTQLQEMYLTRGFQSSVEPIAHFGFKQEDKPKRIKVIWPDGSECEVINPETDKLIEISQTSSHQKIEIDKSGQLIFRDFTTAAHLDFIHHENDFVDYNRETLLPYQFSRVGCALATADVNGDGLDDIYVGGASSQQSVLFIQDANQKFKRATSQPWDADTSKEDMSATFFDVDADSDLDLFVVSGSNEFQYGSSDLDDRLYINNGKGDFKKIDATPADHLNGSCVAAADFDKDGYVDLFVGGNSRPGQFPTVSPSAILRNERDLKTKDIKLVVATKEVNASLREVGMVTDAIWTDFNNDTWPDLIVVGEWMPIRIFRNDKGKLQEVKCESLINSSGLWKRIIARDLDSDGDMDYVIGNAGKNLPWKVSAATPMNLYSSDLNNDGRVDPIITYFNNGKEYPVASRDELLLQINSLRKIYPTYSQFGNATIQDIFKSVNQSITSKLQIQITASVFLINNGNGCFDLKELPIEAQMSCLTGIITDDFNKDGMVDILLAGNFYPYRTQYGSSDAGKGLLLTGNNKFGFKPLRTNFFYFWRCKKYGSGKIHI